jgi:undecaprenyldiphospho-muramoylpentapeptide beta-N-acetylglucosaminyltransferase
LGTSEGLEAKLVPERGYELWPIPKVPLPRRPSLDFFKLPGRLRAAIRSARQAISGAEAEAVIGFGGYVSTPLYLAARKLHVPIIIHEQNARAGLANRLGARFAKRIGATFPGSKLKAAQVTGLPLRREIAELAVARQQDSATVRQAAASKLGLDPNLPTLLVSGGSSGAVSVNQATFEAAPELSRQGIQVLHLTGKGKGEGAAELAAKYPNYHWLEYLTEMELALAAADLVVARSGAGMVGELAALGLPAIYVPLPVGNGEQKLNAEPVIRAGGGILIDDKHFTGAWLVNEVPGLLGDPARLKEMSSAAASVGVVDAAAKVVDLIEAAIEEVSDGS